MIDPKALLGEIRTIAIVGLSPNPLRPSNEVAAFLVERGYDCVGVNPGIAGRTVHGMPVFPTLRAIGRPIDMIDIFRVSAAVGGIVDEALVLPVRPTLIWMQIGVIDRAAKARAEAAGLVVVMDRCPKQVLAEGIA